MIPEGAIEEENTRLEELGIGRPLKDELELKEYMPKDSPLPGDQTSEEENELPGQARPKKGKKVGGVMVQPFYP